MPPPPVAKSQPTEVAAPLVTGAVTGVVRAVIVRGTERLEPETVRSYINLSIGERYDRDRLDQAVKALYAS